MVHVFIHSQFTKKNKIPVTTGIKQNIATFVCKLEPDLLLPYFLFCCYKNAKKYITRFLLIKKQKTYFVKNVTKENFRNRGLIYKKL